MLRILRSRLQQKHRTMKYPDGAPPAMSDRYAGRPVVSDKCAGDCAGCPGLCPTGALQVNNNDGRRRLKIDTGKCLFCRACERACPKSAVAFGRDHRLASASRDGLLIGAEDSGPREILIERARRLFGRSLKLRQVSAGGCNACEADSNVLGTPAWDMGRFGIQFVASPRHADGLLITGPVTENMRLALRKTYDAVPSPKIVIAVGACAISGGPYINHPEVHNGAASVVPVDLFIPGCPPNPLTILEGLLALIGRVER